ncbi:MAG TPA: hypothetical protein PKY59_07475 [Pyrinomonadaceae bacterium]|nr:hypothetical protein [Pyrinomonadaceae bacterium]
MAEEKTSEIFSRLLQSFSENEADAVHLYKDLYASLVRFFRLKGDSFPYQAADITIDRISSRISNNGNIEDLRKFSFGVARLVFFERLRLNEKEKLAVTTFYSQNDFHRNLEENDPLEVFRDSFNSLNDEEKHLLKNYFADMPYSELILHREQMSKDLGISLNRLRQNIFRLREKLEARVKKKIEEK